MKKILLICAASLSAINAFSQITITTSDLPTVNTHVVVVTDTLPTVLPGSGGAAQTWDFSSLNIGSIDTTVFVDPATTLYASDFPTSNLATYNASFDSNVNYLNSSSSALTVLGFGSPDNPFTTDPFIVHFLPSGQDIIQLPATYNQTFSGSYMFKLEFSYSVYGSDSIRVIQHSNYDSDIDGWGNVTTPFGTYSSL